MTFFNCHDARLCLVVFVAIMFAPVQAQVVPPEKIFGEWEVSQVLLTREPDPPHDPPKLGHAALIGRPYSFTRKGVFHGSTGQQGKLDASYAKRTRPMKLLFEDEKVVRPDIAPFFPAPKKATNYPLKEALGTLANKPVTLYVYDESEFQGRTWSYVELRVGAFAAVGDVILVPDTYHDMLLVLRRASKTPSPEKAAFCAKAATVVDKAICTGDPETWRIHRYIETTTPCALSKPAKDASKLPGQIGAAIAKLNACKPDKAGELARCVESALDDHAKLIGSYIPSDKKCVNGDYKDLWLL